MACDELEKPNCRIDQFAKPGRVEFEAFGGDGGEVLTTERFVEIGEPEQVA